MDPELDDWIDRLDAEPEDTSLRQVFSDWLRSRGSDAVAEWMRLEQAHRDGELDLSQRQRFQRYAQDLAASLRARLARPPVENCTSDVPLSFECPRQWQAMRTTDDPEVRHCSSCERSVYWVDTIEAAIEHAQRGHCVAVAPNLQRQPGDLSPRPPWPVHIPPPPGTIMPPRPPDHLEPPRPPVEGLPVDPPKPDAAQPARSWWRRLFGLG